MPRTKKKSQFKVLSEPLGLAGEYAPYGLTLFTTCGHGCEYCYNLKFKGYDYFSVTAVERKNVLELLAKDLAVKKDKDRILLSFYGDCYQHDTDQDPKLTREAIKLFIAHKQPFTILTKGGLKACNDFDLLEGYPKCSFGVTLTTTKSVYDFEPFAAPVTERIESLRLAKQKGIHTWVSAEPILKPEEFFEIVRECKDIVDSWQIGKINTIGLEKTYSYNVLKEIETKTDWQRFKIEALKMMTELKLNFQFKSSLFK